MIAITRADGGVSIMSLAPSADVENAIEQWKESSPGQYVSHSEIESHPADRSMRNAWTLGEGGIGSNVAEVIAIQTARIKAERDRRKLGGVNVGGYWFHSDPDSRIQQIGLKMFGVSVPPMLWKTMSGELVPMTEELANSIFQSVAALDMALFAKAEQHIAAMKNSADPASYDLSTGWPLAFWDKQVGEQ